MSNLQPVARTDKNGRVVIRHMRPDDNNSSATLSFPAPHGAPTQMTEQQAFERNRYINDHKVRIKDTLKKLRVGFWERRRMMETLNPTALSSLVDHGIIQDSNDRYTEIPDDLIRDCVREKSFTLINDLAAYLNDGGEKMGNLNHCRYGEYELVAYLKGLGGSDVSNPNMNAFGFYHYSQANEEQRALQRAVITAARTLDGEFLEVVDITESVWSIGVKSHALVDQIKATPELVPDLVEMINQRRIGPTSTDLWNIEKLIEARSEVPTPLVEGAL